MENDLTTLSNEELLARYQKLRAEQGSSAAALAPNTPAQPTAGPTSHAFMGSPVLEDVARTSEPSLERGAAMLASAPRGLHDVGASAADWAATKVLPEDTAAKFAQTTAGPFSGWPSYQDMVGALEKVRGPLYEAKTPVGKGWQSFLEFAPGMAAGPGGVGTNMVRAAGAAAGSELMGQAAQGDSTIEGPMRMIGALAGHRVSPKTFGVGNGPATAAQRFEQATVPHGNLNFDMNTPGRTTADQLGAVNQSYKQHIAIGSTKPETTPLDPEISNILVGKGGNPNMPNSVNAGMPPQRYLAIRNDLTQKAYAADKTDPALAQGYRGIINHLDDRMGLAAGKRGAVDQQFWNQHKLAIDQANKPRAGALTDMSQMAIGAAGLGGYAMTGAESPLVAALLGGTMVEPGLRLGARALGKVLGRAPGDPQSVARLLATQVPPRFPPYQQEPDQGQAQSVQ